VVYGLRRSRTIGLQVSRICLFCMSYGEPGRGAHPWSLGREAAEAFFRQALDAGARDCSARPSSPRSTTVCRASALTMSISTRFTAGITTHQSSDPRSPARRCQSRQGPLYRCVVNALIRMKSTAEQPSTGAVIEFYWPELPVLYSAAGAPA
jgi:hypothetical protein